LNSGISRQFEIPGISPNQTLDAIITKPESDDWIVLFKNETANRDDLTVKNNYTVVHVDGNTLEVISSFTMDEIWYTGHFYRGTKELYIIGRGALVSENYTTNFVA
jgi:hypothetical protein